MGSFRCVGKIRVQGIFEPAVTNKNWHSGCLTIVKDNSVWKCLVHLDAQAVGKPFREFQLVNNIKGVCIRGGRITITLKNSMITFMVEKDSKASMNVLPKIENILKGILENPERYQQQSPLFSSIGSGSPATKSVSKNSSQNSKMDVFELFDSPDKKKCQTSVKTVSRLDRMKEDIPSKYKHEKTRLTKKAVMDAYMGNSDYDPVNFGMITCDMPVGIYPKDSNVGDIKKIKKIKTVVPILFEKSKEKDKPDGNCLNLDMDKGSQLVNPGSIHSPDNEMKENPSKKYLERGQQKANATVGFYGANHSSQRQYGSLATVGGSARRKPGLLDPYPERKKFGEVGNQRPVDYSWVRRQSPVTHHPDRSLSLLGFSNLGNTCYMNAILQALFSLEPFAADLYRVHQTLCKISGLNKQYLLCSCLAHLLTAKRKQVGCVDVKQFMLSNIKKAISSSAKRFLGHEQHDAHEFLSQVLDQLKEELLKIEKNQDDVEDVPTTPVCNKQNSPSSLVNPTMENFEFEVMHSITCSSCGEKVEKEETFHDLSLDMPKKKSLGSRRTLQDALDQFFVEETVEYSCEYCESKKAYVEHKFIKLPRMNQGDKLGLKRSRDESPLRLASSSTGKVVKFRPNGGAGHRRHQSFSECEKMASSVAENQTRKRLILKNDPPSIQVTAPNEDTVKETLPDVNGHEAMRHEDGRLMSDEEQLQLAISLSTQDTAGTDPDKYCGTHLQDAQESEEIPDGDWESLIPYKIPKLSDRGKTNNCGDFGNSCVQHPDQVMMSYQVDGTGDEDGEVGVKQTVAMDIDDGCGSQELSESLPDLDLVSEIDLLESKKASSGGAHIANGIEGLEEDKENCTPPLSKSPIPLEAPEEVTTPKDKGKGAAPSLGSPELDEEEQIKQVLEMSLHDQGGSGGGASWNENQLEDDLQKAKMLSLQDLGVPVSIEEEMETELPDLVRTPEIEELLAKNAETGDLPESYQLMCVVSHLGSSSTLGHYVSDVYDFHQGSWLSCDDSNIKKTSEEDVRTLREQTGYIFFYQCKNSVAYLENSLGRHNPKLKAGLPPNSTAAKQLNLDTPLFS